jgi:hypothetical protein
VVELYPLESVGELEGLLVPSGMNYKALPSESGSGGKSSHDDLLAKHLRLVPKRQAGTTTCAIRLVDGQVVTIRLVLGKMVAKPAVEFRSAWAKARGGAEIATTLGSLELFRALLLGGDLTFLVDETPPQERERHGERPVKYSLTDTTSYELQYVGTDKESFKAWKFRGTAAQTFRPVPIKDARLGDFYFSAFLPVSSGSGAGVPTSPTHEFGRGEEFYFYVLSRSDISVREMLERLP